jgi:hypothetical protein
VRSPTRGCPERGVAHEDGHGRRSCSRGWTSAVSRAGALACRGSEAPVLLSSDRIDRIERRVPSISP